MMANALKGYNVTVLAYGQTNSGKTFTIRGGQGRRDASSWQDGIIPLTGAALFRQVAYLKTPEGIAESLREKADTSVDSFRLPTLPERTSGDRNVDMTEDEAGGVPRSRPDSGANDSCMVDRNISIRVSYMEIYNENVNDLLDGSRRNLEVRDLGKDGRGGVHVEHLTCKTVRSTEELQRLVDLGEQTRVIAETRQNSKSTRSHTVFRIEVEIDDRIIQTGRHTIRTSQIQIVDLAGSEGASKAKSQGLRLREGGNINKSLLALSTVIGKLAQRQQMGAKHNYYINFRDSKLTRILQASLCGKSQTAIICCISQLPANTHESVQALQFGGKAKRIRTQVDINEIVRESPDRTAHKIAKMSRDIQQLQSQVS